MRAIRPVRTGGVRLPGPWSRGRLSPPGCCRQPERSSHPPRWTGCSCARWPATRRTRPCWSSPHLLHCCGDQLLGVGRARRVCPKVLEGHPVPADFAWVFHVEAAGQRVQARHILVVRVGEREQDEAGLHRDVRSGTEWHHLDRDVRPLAYVRELLELGAHHVRAACKWGLSDDTPRAVAVRESTWYQYETYPAGRPVIDWGSGDMMPAGTTGADSYCAEIGRYGHDYRRDFGARTCPRTFSIVGVMSWQDPSWGALSGNQKVPSPSTGTPPRSPSTTWDHSHVAATRAGRP